MRQEIIIAGFGGQGVLLMGQILTYAGMLEGKHVSWIPAYGPEMRGGTANCSVIIADHPIGSPIVYEPTAVVVMNVQSFDKFEPTVQAQGILIINSSLIEKTVKREDIEVYPIPVNELAAELGNGKMANMVCLGGLIAATQAVEIESLYQAFAKKFATKPELLIPNKKAMQKGYACVKQGHVF